MHTSRLAASHRLVHILALTLALGASGSALATPDPFPEVRPVTILADGATRRPIAPGVYEVAYSPATKALYVASAEAITGVQGGVIYKLDPETLQTLGMTHTDEKNFGLTTNPDGTRLFITNSLNSSLSVMNTETGRIEGRITFQERSDDGSAYGPRKVIYDETQQAVYVGGVGDPGRIWLVDAQTLEVRASIGNAGKWVTGLLLDAEAHRLYATNGDGEVLVIDTRDNHIQERWTPGDGKEWLLLNMALDKARHRLYVTDNSKQKTVVIFDTRTGKPTGRIDAGDSLDIQYDQARDRLYVSHRQRGMFSVIDAETLRTVKTYSLPQMPNSVIIGPEGKTVYVTIKTPHKKDYSASGDGSIARIPLQ